eukprot:31303-Pelagococcus_subviridis.AAC.40
MTRGVFVFHFIRDQTDALPPVRVHVYIHVVFPPIYSGSSLILTTPQFACDVVNTPTNMSSHSASAADLYPNALFLNAFIAARSSAAAGNSFCARRQSAR